MLFSEVARLLQCAEEEPSKFSSGVPRVNLSAAFAITLSKASWYDDYMFTRRIRGARELSLDTSCVIMDGNMKLNGRCCGRPVAELTHSPELGLFTASPCSKSPLFGKRRCRDHDCSLPLNAPGAGEEVAVAHRRRRVLSSVASSSGYDLLLKPIDYVLADNAAAVAGRWVSSTSCTDRQVHDYWGSKEVDGFVFISKLLVRR